MVSNGRKTTQKGDRMKCMKETLRRHENSAWISYGKREKARQDTESPNGPQTALEKGSCHRRKSADVGTQRLKHG